MGLNDFLSMMTRADGIGAISGFLMAFALEWIPGWANISPKQRRAFTMEISFLLPLLGMLLSGYTGLDGLFLAASVGFSAFFGTQVGHTQIGLK